MGLLDRFFGQGEQEGFLPSGNAGGQPSQTSQGQQGVAPDNWWSRFRAEYAPGAYAAHQQNLQQQALYSALLQNGASPEMARGFAMSPQLLGMGGEAYLPSAAQVEWKQDPYTGQWGAYSVGRGKGGQPYVNEVNMNQGGPPGTTANPTQAAQGAQRITQQPAQESAQRPSNKAGGDLPSQIEAARAQGADVETLIKSFVPPGIQNQVRGLRSGKILPDQLKGQTAENIERITQLVDPEWNRAKAAGANAYIKDFMSGQTKDSVNAIDNTLETLDRALSQGGSLGNMDLWFSGASSGVNKALQSGGKKAEGAIAFNDTNRALAQNLFKLMSGSKRYSKPAVEDFQKDFGSGMRPAELATAANARLDEIVGRIDELEKERNDRVGSAKDYPIKSADFDQKVAALRQKIQALHGQNNNPNVAAVVNPIGTAVYNAIKQPSGLPSGWKIIE